MRTKQLILRWSIVTSSIIVLFWTIYYLIVGNVPIITDIKITQDWSVTLPFGISRWWDILIGPIWSTVIILLLTSKKLNEEDLGFSLVFSLVFGLILGLVFGLGFGLVYSLFFGLVLGLVFGLVFGLVYSLFFGLVLGLVFGLGFGLGFGLVLGLVFGLGFGLGFLTKLVAISNFRTKFWDWLLVK